MKKEREKGNKKERRKKERRQEGNKEMERKLERIIRGEKKWKRIAGFVLRFRYQQGKLFDDEPQPVHMPMQGLYDLFMGSDDPYACAASVAPSTKASKKKRDFDDLEPGEQKMFKDFFPRMWNQIWLPVFRETKMTGDAWVEIFLKPSCWGNDGVSVTQQLLPRLFLYTLRACDAQCCRHSEFPSHLGLCQPLHRSVLQHFL